MNQQSKSRVGDLELFAIRLQQDDPARILIGPEVLDNLLNAGNTYFYDGRFFALFAGLGLQLYWEANGHHFTRVLTREQTREYFQILDIHGIGIGE